MTGAVVGAGSYTFTALDWAIVIGYLAFTTFVGARLSGKQATIKDFFLGGRKLPWYAVSGSIIATEISAVSFVGVPAIVFAAGGNFTYLQLGIGTILARVIIGYWFVPAFYEREIYSPYDYMANRLGPRVKQVITGLFIVGQLLGQGVRVYLTAMVLQIVTGGHLSLDASIWIIGGISIVWTIMGGITTVIWTDVMLFGLFLVGAVIAMFFVVGHVPGGWGAVVAAGQEAGKFRVFDFSTDPTLEFTFWAGVVASTWGSLNAYGTDQLIAQRMFCCRGPRQARWAIVSSSFGLVVAVSLLFVGVGLYAYYRHQAQVTLAQRAVGPDGSVARAQLERMDKLGARPDLSGEEKKELNALMAETAFNSADAEIMKENRNRVFPIFIVRVIPPGLTGLIVAAIFAAAISSLDSILAALSQTFISAFYAPWRRRRLGLDDIATLSPVEERRQIRMSRLLIVVSGIALSGMAYVGMLASGRYQDILILALSMVGYTGVALLAAFMLAFLRIPVDDKGIVWAAPLSLIGVFGLAWKDLWATQALFAACGVILLLWVCFRSDKRRWIRKTVFLAFGILVVFALHFYAGVPVPEPGLPAALAFPWFIPIGSVIAFAFGWLLADGNELQRTQRALGER